MGGADPKAVKKPNLSASDGKISSPNPMFRPRYLLGFYSAPNAKEPSRRSGTAAHPPGLAVRPAPLPRPPHTTAQTGGRGLELSCLITKVPLPRTKNHGIKGNMPGCPWWDRTELQNCSESCP